MRPARGGSGAALRLTSAPEGRRALAPSRPMRRGGRASLGRIVAGTTAVLLAGITAIGPLPSATAAATAVAEAATARATTAPAAATTETARRSDAPPTRIPTDEGEILRLVDREIVRFEETTQDRTDGTFVIRWAPQVVARTLDLPRPSTAGIPDGIICRVTVTPIQSLDVGNPNPMDPWTRLGAVTVSDPVPDDGDDAGDGDGTAGAATGRTGGGQSSDPAAADGADRPMETELIRFTTGYGAGGTYEADVTALAPLLTGRKTIRVFVQTYGDYPGWEVSVSLLYRPGRAGLREPLLARPIFDDYHVDAVAPTLRREVVVPAGIESPRLRILTTGHATDGQGANEFVTATHILSVDGREVARWRPWRENGPWLRDRNPWAGRIAIGDRVIRSCDLDRSGWAPGMAVEPLIIPLPELRPGRTTIELTIVGIRPVAPTGGPHGYFVVGATLLADQAR